MSSKKPKNLYVLTYHLKSTFITTSVYRLTYKTVRVKKKKKKTSQCFFFLKQRCWPNQSSTSGLPSILLFFLLSPSFCPAVILPGQALQFPHSWETVNTWPLFQSSWKLRQTWKQSKFQLCRVRVFWVSGEWSKKVVQDLCCPWGGTCQSRNNMRPSIWISLTISYSLYWQTCQRVVIWPVVVQE